MGLCIQPPWLCAVWMSGMAIALCYAALLHVTHGDPVSSAVGTKLVFEPSPMGWIIEAVVGVGARCRLHGQGQSAPLQVRQTRRSMTCLKCCPPSPQVES